MSIRNNQLLLIVSNKLTTSLSWELPTSLKLLILLWKDPEDSIKSSMSLFLMWKVARISSLITSKRSKLTVPYWIYSLQIWSLSLADVSPSTLARQTIGFSGIFCLNLFVEPSQSQVLISKTWSILLSSTPSKTVNKHPISTLSIIL